MQQKKEGEQKKAYNSSFNAVFFVHNHSSFFNKAAKLTFLRSCRAGHPISVRTEIGERTVGHPFNWVSEPSRMTKGQTPQWTPLLQNNRLTTIDIILILGVKNGLQYRKICRHA